MKGSHRLYRRIAIDVRQQRRLEAERRQGRPQRVSSSPLSTTRSHVSLSATIAERVLDRQVQRSGREER
jgi:hypothetical protein